MPKLKPAAAYLRRSTDRQEQSIDDQARAIERFASEKGLVVVKTYTDDAISGADTQARKSFLAMIADAQRRERGFDTILVYDVSRFGRVGADEAGHYRHLLAQAGVEVIYVAEGLRGDQTDDLLLGVKQFVAHQTVVDLSKVTIRGQLSRVAKGRWCGGRPPYGFDLQYTDQSGSVYQVVRFLDNGDRELRTARGELIRVVPRGSPLPVTKKDAATLVPSDPARVAVVQRIFSEYVHGEAGYSTIADRLNRDQIPSAVAARLGTRWKGSWSQGTIREILRNPAYRGAMAWNRISYAKFHRVENQQAVARPKFSLGKVKRNAEADWVVIEGTHEALVTPELFARAGRLMASRSGLARESLRTSPGSSPYLLSGLVTCARCGAKWQGYKIGKGRKKPGQRRIETFYYACGGYVRKGNAVCPRALVAKDEFEVTVVKEVGRYIQEFVSSGGAALLAGLLSEVARPEQAQAREKALRERLRELEAKQDELIQCLTPALAPVLEPKIVALKADADTARAELEATRASRLTAERAADLVAALGQGMEAAERVLQAGTLIERREILRGLIQRIVLDTAKDEAVITFFAVPKTPGPGGGGGTGAGGVRSAAPSRNEKSTDLDDLCSLYSMAGARSRTPERTISVRSTARGWLRMALVWAL